MTDWNGGSLSVSFCFLPESPVGHSISNGLCSGALDVAQTKTTQTKKNALYLITDNKNIA